MKIRSVSINNHKKAFMVKTSSKEYCFPFAKLEEWPFSEDPITQVYVDKELGNEAFTYVLESGKEGTVHIDHVLDYNQDPVYMRNLLLYQLTMEAQKRIEEGPLSKREITRRLGTSATQLYRLLDQTNYRKSVDQMLYLLNVLDCDVEFTVHAKSA